MNITGMEYFVVSNKKPDIVLNGFNKAIVELWPNCIIYENDKLFDGSFFYGYVKDHEMENFSEENAYKLDQHGEGQISLACQYYRSLRMNTMADYAYNDGYEDLYDDCPKDSILRKNIFILHEVYYYTLILPGTHEHPFSRKIINILEDILLKKSEI